MPACRDNRTVDCDTAREALSARIDGEAEPVSPDDHFDTCTECREWYAVAASLTWEYPDEPAPMPDFVDEVLDQVEPRDGLLGPTRWHPRRPR
jgi:predicted anti-sigma-YlaC factor YlaD